MEKWNGISMLWATQRYLSDTTVYSDASGSWGCGALWQQKWFNFPWSAKLQTCSIAVKQLVPVVVTASYVVHRVKAHFLKSPQSTEKWSPRAYHSGCKLKQTCNGLKCFL